MNETYIGDGVYVHHDGCHIVLRTERYGRWETIYLEPAVWHALIRWLRWVQCDPDSPACIPDNERYAASGKHGLGPKNPRLRELTNEKPFRLPSFEDRYKKFVAYLPYTPELWAGLLVIVRTIAGSRQTLHQLLGTKTGVATIAEVGAGRQLLQLTSGNAA